MITRLTKTLTLLGLFFVCFHCKTLATVYYVNASNPTPGSGTTWATAFTDFNAALTAATGVFDQIWVAKGTYYPTTTTNRAATFTIAGGIPIYGGFNGTETAYTQANPTANPTILSGDIGIPGNPTDNSYHVVTYYMPTAGSNLTMDGFTITGGYADQGYPGSTTPSLGNTGGGFLEYSINGQMASASISHCTFTNNFAVYGGGFGVYGDASSTFYGLVYCSFTNNTAWSGGAVASLGFNVNWSNDEIDQSTFIGNISLNNQGSAITTMNTNGTAGYAMLTTVTNCIFYNDAQPQLYNQCTAGTGSLQVYCSIIWNSVAPYTGPLSGGNSVLIDICDLDLVTPLSSNLDIDPQFTNAAAGDFHVPHCSPLIDQGFTTDGFNIGKKDPDGNPRILGPKTDIGLYESQLPASPTAPTVTYCQYQAAVPLTATVAAGNSMLWYTASTGGTGSTTPITPSTATASAFPTYYYVSAVDANGCESSRYGIAVTVNAGATAPTAPSPTYCLNATATALTATGSNLLWYTASTGGIGDPTAPTPATTATGTTTYYVTQTPASSCESARTPVTVTISAAAAAPTATAISYCLNSTATALTATGTNLLWYTASTGGTGTPTAPTPATTSAGSTDYYVTQTPAGSCESSRTPLTVTINPDATAPGTTPENYCLNATASPLTATGTNLLWYAASTGGTGTPTAPTPATTSAGTTDYYVSQTPAGSCESPRSLITVTIGSPASAPGTAPQTYCQNTTAAPLTATGTNLLWYTASSGGTGSSTAPTPVTTSAGSTDYYVSQTPAGSCESSRTPLTVTITPGATAPGTTPESYCLNATATPLTATGTNLLWYTTATGGTGNPTAPTPSTTSAGTTDYYVTQTPAGSCESNRSAITVTIGSPAAAPITAPETYCQNATATPLTATGANLLWYTTATGGTGTSAAPTPSTTNSGSTDYYVTQTPAGSCESSRTPLTVTINPDPKVGIAPPPTSLCLGVDIPLEAYGAKFFQWSPATDLSNPDIGNPVAKLEGNIQYTVTGTDDNGCSATAKITLDVTPDCLAYYIPDAFTPNGDGNNDLFRVKTGDVPKTSSLIIFNRWGAKVFESQDIGAGWNGTFGGNKAPTGTYVYIFQAVTSAGTPVKKQGTLILIR